MTATAAGPILLAEDNPVNQRVATAMLEQLGFQVDVVSGGVAAVNAAAVTPYQAILMDCQLQEMDGFQAAAQIRRFRGASRNTPIIAVTSADKDSDHLRCVSAGMDDFLAKPISQRGLADMLARWAPDASASPIVTTEPALDAPDTAPYDAPAAPDALDAEVVMRLERLGAAAGEDLMGQLTILYLADSEDHLVEIRSALGACDASAIYRAAHTLTGSSANIGAIGLSRLCATLAINGNAGDLTDSESLIEAIEAELLRVRSSLESRSATS